jgi:GDPmannose 4,6-dehydratase
MNALIMGVDGQDGSFMAEFLLSKGYRVIGWVPKGIPINKTNLQPFLHKISLIEGTLVDQDQLFDDIQKTQPDEVYNFASPSFPASSWESVVAISDVTALGVARVLEAMRQVNPQIRYYQASSSELFGNPMASPQTEETAFNPRNPYGVAKLYAHYLTKNYRQKYGIYAVSGIAYNHESPKRGKEFVTRKITSQAALIKLGLGQELRLGNLDARRDWGYAGDYVVAMWMMLQQQEPKDYIISSGKTHSVRDICKIAFSHLGLDYLDFVIEDSHFYRPNEPVQLVGDSSKIRQDLGWEPKITFEELIQMMIDHDLLELGASVLTEQNRLSSN